MGKMRSIAQFAVRAIGMICILRFWGAQTARNVVSSVNVFVDCCVRSDVFVEVEHDHCFTF